MRIITSVLFILLFNQAEASFDLLDRHILSSIYAFLDPADLGTLSRTARTFHRADVTSDHLINLDFNYDPAHIPTSRLLRSRVRSINLLMMEESKHPEKDLEAILQLFINVKEVLLPPFIPARHTDTLFEKKGIECTYPHLELKRLCTQAGKLKQYPFLERIMYGSGYLNYISLNHLQAMKTIPESNRVLIIEILTTLIPKDFKHDNNPLVVLTTGQDMHAVSILSLLLTELSLLDTEDLSITLNYLKALEVQPEIKTWACVLLHWQQLQQHLEIQKASKKQSGSCTIL